MLGLIGSLPCIKRTSIEGTIFLCKIDYLYWRKISCFSYFCTIENPSGILLIGVLNLAFERVFVLSDAEDNRGLAQIVLENIELRTRASQARWIFANAGVRAWFCSDIFYIIRPNGPIQQSEALRPENFSEKKANRALEPPSDRNLIIRLLV